MYKIDYGFELVRAPQWRTRMCLVDGTCGRIATEDLHPDVVGKVLKNNRGWGKKHMLQKCPNHFEALRAREHEPEKVIFEREPHVEPE